MKTIGDYRYVALVLPLNDDYSIDEPRYRALVRHFADNPRFAAQGGLCVNPEAGEIFYMTRQEKRRVLEIAMEEAKGKLPIIAGTWAMTTDETVQTAIDAKAVGADGIFVTPPQGFGDITSSWDAEKYPEVWLDQIIAQDRAVDLPIVTHPVSGGTIPFYPGLPLQATLKICREVPNVVGWKMTYMYDGFQIIAKALRKLDRHVAVMGALGARFHEYRATQCFDGTLSGFWNYALEPMVEHLDAWDQMDVVRANEVWNAGLSDLQSYIADFSRLHIRYKVASWLVGHCASPLMRQPMPKPRQEEIDTIYRLLGAAGIQTIDKKDTLLAA